MATASHGGVLELSVARNAPSARLSEAGVEESVAKTRLPLEMFAELGCSSTWLSRACGLELSRRAAGGVERSSETATSVDSSGVESGGVKPRDVKVTGPIGSGVALAVT